MQKLGIFIYSLGSGGAERVVATLLPILSLKFEVHLILMNDKISYEIPECQIHFLECSKPSENPILKFLKLPFLALKYKKLCRNLGIDTEFVFLNRPNYIALMARMFGNKTHLVINECTTPSVMYAKNNFNSLANKFLISLLYPRADLILPNSKGNLEDLVQNFSINPKKCEILYNAIDMFYFPSKYGVVLGSSPEFLLKIKKREIYLAPIAGTRNLENNCDLLALEKDLLSDEKELSEHKMLVDLARNDASKFGTQTRVENLFSIIKNKFVMHIVSEVYANMKEDASIFDVIEAVFPAGTLSGAPKIRALEITSELEDCDRGIYGGAVGFLNFNEDITLAILIRCAFFTQDKAYLASGAGIVLQSESQKEYAEICAKRKALLVAFENLKKENQ